MQLEKVTIRDLEDQLACLNADLYQTCGTMSVQSLERLCRKINLIRFKIYSFKGGRYGNKKNNE